MVLPCNKYNRPSVFKSTCLSTSACKSVPKDEEALYVFKVLWLKKAKTVKDGLSTLNNAAWASALELTEEELAACLKQAEFALNELSLMGLRLSLKLAKAYRRLYSYQDWLDVVHEGFLAFNEALDDYDPSKSTRLSTYAYAKIRARYTTLNRRADNCAEVSQFSELQIHDYLTRSIHGADLDIVIGVQEALTELPDRQRSILEKRFGFEGEPQGVRTIARDFGVSCRTICSDQSAAMLTLLKNCNLERLAA